MRLTDVEHTGKATGTQYLYRGLGGLHHCTSLLMDSGIANRPHPCLEGCTTKRVSFLIHTSLLVPVETLFDTTLGSVLIHIGTSTL